MLQLSVTSFTQKFPETACLQAKIYCATSTISDSENSLSWKEVKKIIDKVQKHVCGHASLSDIQILFERNNVWNPEIRKYLSRAVESCIHCAKTYELKRTRKVSLNSLNRSFNDRVCIDQFHLGGQRICHIMCASTRYYVGTVAPDVGIESAVNALDSLLDISVLVSESDTI